MSIQDGLITRTQFAGELGLCERSIYGLMDRGICPRPEIQIGKKKFWTEKQVNSVKKKLLHLEDDE